MAPNKSTSKNLVAASALLGASAIGADAFVAPGAPVQHDSPVALRGATEQRAQPSMAPQAVMVAAAGAVALGAGAAKRRAPRSSNIVCNFNKEAQLGAQEPLGFFDPAGFCEDEEKFNDFRCKEIKHGRLAMMGALGMLTQSLVQVPGMEGVPTGVLACTVGNGKVGFLAVLAVIAGLEVAVFVQDPAKEPGNFGNPLPWFDDYSDEMRGKELNNGRIAMFSAIGIIASSLYTGRSAVEQFSS